MSKIKILPENIANQIAAGEVVERPVAIVKELLENSIDAGAKHVSVTFISGGKSKITVDDDGVGMSKEDAEMSVVRHATSKISNISDLQKLNTFGFRGEALSSISSVSKFLMRTRQKSDNVGTELLINCEKDNISLGACGMAYGTYIEVSNLFHNVPARRRFLKSDETEAGHIIKTVKSFIFAEKDVDITLFEGNRKLCESIKTDSWAARAREIFGISDNLCDIFYEKNGVSIEGAICMPGQGDTNARNIMTFVNRRCVSSNVVNCAVNEAFAGFLPSNRKPVAFLLLNIDKAAVDVNVHPTKREVRFRNEYVIRDFIKEAIDFWIKKCNESVLGVSYEQKSARDRCAFFAPTFIKNSSGNGGTHNSIFAPKQNEIPGVVFDDKTNEVFSVNDKKWSFVGVVYDNCALFESNNGLILFNANLAVRRIVYENILINTEVSSQKLLLPINVKIETNEVEALDSLLPELENFGVKMYQSGECLYRINEIPQWIDIGSAEMFVRDMLEQFGEVIKSNGNDFHKNCALKASYWASSENYTTELDIEKLIAKLSKCENSLTCPRGFQIFYEIPFSDLKKRFGV